MNLKSTAIALLLFYLAQTNVAAQGLLQTKDVKMLLQGVKRIDKPGLPGPIAIISKHATTLVAARVKGGNALPLVVVARHGRGSVLVFGHDGYLSAKQLRGSDSGQLFLNYLLWCKVAGKDSIGLVGHKGVQQFLIDAKHKTRVLERDTWHKHLKRCKTLVLGQGDVLTRIQASALESWVKSGGNLIAGGLVWGWRQLNPTKDSAKDHMLNQALSLMGIFLDGGTIDQVIQPTDANPALLSSCSAARALTTLKQSRSGAKIPMKVLQQAGQVVTSAVRWIPNTRSGFLDQVRRLIGQTSVHVVPTKKKPLTKRNTFERLALTVDHLLSFRLPPKEVKASASASDFPGQPSKQDRPVTKTFKIDSTRPGWHSLGLYARAGTVVAVTLPNAFATQRLRLRIGSHKDELWNKAKWTRHPEISRSWAISRSKQEFASPHGGLVYVEVPRRMATKTFTVTVSGAVPSLYFVLGKTNLHDWQEATSSITAPWAELECSLVTLTVKRESAARLDDPTELMKFWENTLKLYAKLGQRPLNKQPQRFVADRQISAGWLHSGYPIMMQLLHSDEIVNLARLRDAPKDESYGWGFWHELGHNHQRPYWTFRGTTEVTCNLFSLFVDDQVRGVKPIEHPWAQGSRAKVAPFIEKGPSFARWKKEPGLALWTYILIQDAFGWAPFQNVFAKYEDDSPQDRPRTDQAKRDRFMVRMSQACKRDLGPYFAAWGIPISSEARRLTSALKPWLPKKIKAFAKHGK